MEKRNLTWFHRWVAMELCRGKVKYAFGVGILSGRITIAKIVSHWAGFLLFSFQIHSPPLCTLLFALESWPMWTTYTKAPVSPGCWQGGVNGEKPEYIPLVPLLWGHLGLVDCICERRSLLFSRLPSLHGWVILDSLGCVFPLTFFQSYSNALYDATSLKFTQYPLWFLYSYPHLCNWSPDKSAPLDLSQFEWVICFCWLYQTDTPISLIINL